MALSTAGIIIGALLLTLGLVLVLLPQTFQGTHSASEIVPMGSQSVALLQVHVPYDNFSLGGTSITLNFQASGSVPISAVLYTAADGEAILDGSTPTGAGLASASNEVQGSLTSNAIQPGQWYAVVFFEPSNSTNESVSVSWTGSFEFPYALIGLPLVVLGGIILVGVVAAMPNRPPREEEVGEAAGGAYGPGYGYATPPVMVEGPPPSNVPPPHVGVYPSSSTPAALPAPGGALSPRPPVTDTSSASPGAASGSRHHFWRATPLTQPSTPVSTDNDRAASPPPRSSSLTMPSVPAEAPPTSPVTPAASAATETPSGAPQCPRCHLAIGDESWAFCPRCRAELD